MSSYHYSSYSASSASRTTSTSGGVFSSGMGLSAPLTGLSTTVPMTLMPSAESFAVTGGQTNVPLNPLAVPSLAGSRSSSSSRLVTKEYSSNTGESGPQMVTTVTERRTVKNPDMVAPVTTVQTYEERTSPTGVSTVSVHDRTGEGSDAALPITGIPSATGLLTAGMPRMTSTASETPTVGGAGVATATSGTQQTATVLTGDPLPITGLPSSTMVMTAGMPRITTTITETRGTPMTAIRTFDGHTVPSSVTGVLSGYERTGIMANTELPMATVQPTLLTMGTPQMTVTETRKVSNVDMPVVTETRKVSNMDMPQMTVTEMRKVSNMEMDGPVTSVRTYGGVPMTTSFSSAQESTTSMTGDPLPITGLPSSTTVVTAGMPRITTTVTETRGTPMTAIGTFETGAGLLGTSGSGLSASRNLSSSSQTYHGGSSYHYSYGSSSSSSASASYRSSGGHTASSIPMMTHTMPLTGVSYQLGSPGWNLVSQEVTTHPPLQQPSVEQNALNTQKEQE